MGRFNYKFLILFLIIIFILSISSNVLGGEWRHPDCPKDFEGYKEEYGIPRWEFENIFQVCYWTEEDYKNDLAVQNEHQRFPADHPDYIEKTKKTEAKLKEWREKYPPIPKVTIPRSELPPTPAPPIGSNISEFGTWMSPEESRANTLINKDKIWWIKDVKSWKEETKITNKYSIHYPIQNYKNKMVRNLKSKIWEFLFK